MSPNALWPVTFGLIFAQTLLALGELPSRVNEDRQPLSDILARAGLYVRRFEQDFAVVISDEVYKQTEFDTGVRTLPARTRTMKSEMLFMWIADDQRWLSIRNVVAVDGRAVPGSSARLERTLKDPLPDLASRLHVIAEESARFNIGTIHRNFNNPTLALQFLDPSYQTRFTFTLDEHERAQTIDGVAAWKVTFAELQHPTVIVDDDGHRDVVSSGAIWFRVSDGNALRTNLTLTQPYAPQVSIVVNYRHDGRLDMWVPARMVEHYRTVFNQIDSQMIECVATYSNYRRFQTSARIISPK